MRTWLGYALVLLAALMWGCVGVFSRALGFMGCLLTMLSKRATRGVDPLTVVFYGFAAGAVVMLAVANPFAKVLDGVPPAFGPTLLAFGLIPAALAYLCYMTGLSYGLEASRVPVITSFENVTDVAIGIGAFGEPINPGKMLGILLVLMSMACISLDISARMKALRGHLELKG